MEISLSVDDLKDNHGNDLSEKYYFHDLHIFIYHFGEDVFNLITEFGKKYLEKSLEGQEAQDFVVKLQKALSSSLEDIDRRDTAPIKLIEEAEKFLDIPVKKAKITLYCYIY